MPRISRVLHNVNEPKSPPIMDPIIFTIGNGEISSIPGLALITDVNKLTAHYPNNNEFYRGAREIINSGGKLLVLNIYDNIRSNSLDSYFNSPVTCKAQLSKIGEGIVYSGIIGGDPNNLIYSSRILDDLVSQEDVDLYESGQHKSRYKMGTGIHARVNDQINRLLSTNSVVQISSLGSGYLYEDISVYFTVINEIITVQVSFRDIIEEFTGEWDSASSDNIERLVNTKSNLIRIRFSRKINPKYINCLGARLVYSYEVTDQNRLVDKNVLNDLIRSEDWSPYLISILDDSLYKNRFVNEIIELAYSVYDCPMLFSDSSLYYRLASKYNRITALINLPNNLKINIRGGLPNDTVSSIVPALVSISKDDYLGEVDYDIYNNNYLGTKNKYTRSNNNSLDQLLSFDGNNEWIINVWCTKVLKLTENLIYQQIPNIDSESVNSILDIVKSRLRYIDSYTIDKLFIENNQAIISLSLVSEMLNISNKQLIINIDLK